MDVKKELIFVFWDLIKSFFKDEPKKECSTYLC